METTDIQQNLQKIDESAKALWNEITSLNSQIANCEAQAIQCQNMANSILSSISEQDDYSSKVTEAREYVVRSEQYKMMSKECETQILAVKHELHGYIEHYEYYKGECENNIQSLNLAIQKLMSVPPSKYTSGLSDAMMSAKQKLLLNERFREGCISRIDSIQQICGDDGSAKIKVLKR